MNSKISSAKTAIVLDQPFFGSLVCNLKFTEDTQCDTAWTDGTTLGYNPAYVDSLTHAELVGLICHETLHCASGHPFRRDARDPKKFNVACDLAINQIVTEAGMTLPQGSLTANVDQHGKSAEWIYDRLPDMPPDPNDGQGSGAPGEVRDSPSPDGDGDAQDSPNSEQDWQQITRQAAQQAKAMGSLPSGLARFAKDAVQPKVDWKSVLRRFVQQNAKSDYTWSRPSSRYASQDIYLPSLQSEDMPPIAIAVDTSGSMDDVALQAAKAEVLAVMSETNPTRIDVLYADARVASHDIFERGEDIIFKPAGGGGTDFRPVFDAIGEMDEQPCCVIYITDLCGTFPNEAPDGPPVLWVTDTDLVAPFGDTIKM